MPDYNFPEWDKCQTTFENQLLHVSDEGTIEDDGEGLLQVDFANKYLGGGVLNYGCVQEEIRFVICPELLCSRLFTEALLDNECLLVLGCERFSYYNGYASTFQWTGDYVDQTPFDSFRRRKCGIVAIDAIHFKSRSAQYSRDMISRELNKVCYTMFWSVFVLFYFQFCLFEFFTEMFIIEFILFPLFDRLT